MSDSTQKPAMKHAIHDVAPMGRKGIMGGAKTDIALASATILIPTLGLSAILLALVYSHQMPNNSSTYTVGNETAKPLGSAYYVDYSATTLVYIASLSSTAATLLLSAVMLLSSYVFASSLSKRSDSGEDSLLPSPYQLELLIRMVEGRLTVLWSYVLYLFSSKKERIKITPTLWKASAVMTILGTKSVQYLEMRPDRPEGLTPGRDLSAACLSDPRGDIPGPTGGINVENPADCILFRGDAVNQATLVNQTEFVRTAGNQSTINQVVFDSGYAVLGPHNPPVDLDFEATTFGSKTVCQAVTFACGAKSITGARVPLPWYSNFICNETAGLNMTGNFDELTASTTGTVPEPTEGVKGNPATRIEDDNSLLLSPYDMGFQYFQDPAKQKQVVIEGTGSRPDTYRLDWAVVFQLHLNWAFWIDNNNPSGVPIKNETGEINPEGSIRVKDSRPPRQNASIPFVSGITDTWAFEQLHQGLQQSFVRAKSPEDLAAGFASAYDQALLSVPAGVMQQIPAVNVTRRVVTQVARVPIAPFLTLILLNLLYALVGIVLTVAALLAVSKGHGVKDIQARLSVAAVVAESFESPALRDDARDLDELYAERRGRMTRRIAFEVTEHGGRSFRQIDIKGEKNEGGELLR
ncbi:MAG: hypothetical protein Q9219_006769 [cf. Caloplaca sp. 3 TL-2023]